MLLCVFFFFVAVGCVVLCCVTALIVWAVRRRANNATDNSNYYENDSEHDVRMSLASPGFVSARPNDECKPAFVVGIEPHRFDFHVLLQMDNCQLRCLAMEHRTLLSGVVDDDLVRNQKT
jgi:hypothetical protein